MISVEYLSSFVIILIVIVLLLLVAYFMIGNYFFNLALNPNTSKEFVLGVITEETMEEKERRIQEISLGWLGRIQKRYPRKRMG